jgi:hypothetical protein
MSKQLKRICRYPFCEHSTKKESKYCSFDCPSYKEWYDVIIPHIDKFNTTPFDVDKTIKELEQIDSFKKRLDYWIEKHWKPLYQWIYDLDFTKYHNIIGAIQEYQNTLRYDYNKTPRADFWGSELRIPGVIYRQFYDIENRPPYYNYILYKYNGKAKRNYYLKQDKWHEKLLNTNREYLITEITKYLDSLDKQEKEVKHLYSKEKIVDIQKYDPEYKTNKESRKSRILLRILYNYYQTSVPFENEKSYLDLEVFELYAKHIYIREFLTQKLEELQQTNQTSETTNHSQITCPYYPNNCTRSIKRLDESCYPKCNVYQEWYDVIIPHINKFNRTPFDTDKTIKELKQIDNIAERVKYWIEEHWKPLYQWMYDLGYHYARRGTLTKYQDRLKYWSIPNITYEDTKDINGKRVPNNYDLAYSQYLSIPHIIFKQFYKPYQNTPDFFYTFLKHSAKVFSYDLLIFGNWKQKLDAPTDHAILEITKYLDELDKKEKEAEQLYKDGIIPDIYRRQIDYQYYNNIKKLRARILLKIKGNFYKKNPLDNSELSRKLEIRTLYAEHIYIREFLTKKLEVLQQKGTSQKHLPVQDKNTNKVASQQIEAEPFSFEKKITTKELNLSLIEFIELISGYNEIKKYTIVIDYTDEVKGTLPQLKEIANNIDSRVLKKKIHQIETNATCNLSKIEIYNYLQRLTDDFKREKIKLILKDMEVFRDMTLFEEMNILAEQHYIQKGWDIPVIDSQNGKFDIITTNDYQKMRNRVFPFLIESFSKTILLLQSKIENDYKINKPKVLEESNLIEQTVKRYFAYTLEQDDRTHKQVLAEKDHSNLIKWVAYFFENRFELPKIKNPIKKVNTTKGNIFWTFKRLFNELHPSKTRPDDLYILITKVFYEYRDDKIENIKKLGKPNYYSGID